MRQHEKRYNSFLGESSFSGRTPAKRCAKARNESSDRPWKLCWGPLWRNMRSSATRRDAARVPGRNSLKRAPDRRGGPGQVTTCPYYKPQSSPLEIRPQFPAFAVCPGIRRCGIVRATQESRTFPQGRVRPRTGWSRYEEGEGFP